MSIFFGENKFHAVKTMFSFETLKLFTENFTKQKFVYAFLLFSQVQTKVTQVLKKLSDAKIARFPYRTI